MEGLDALEKIKNIEDKLTVDLNTLFTKVVGKYVYFIKPFERIPHRDIKEVMKEEYIPIHHGKVLRLEIGPCASECYIVIDFHGTEFEEQWQKELYIKIIDFGKFWALTKEELL